MAEVAARTRAEALHCPQRPSVDELRRDRRIIQREITQLEAHGQRLHAAAMREQSSARTGGRRNPDAERQVVTLLAQGRALGLGDEDDRQGGLMVDLEPKKRKRGY